MVSSHTPRPAHSAFSFVPWTEAVPVLGSASPSLCTTAAPPEAVASSTDKESRLGGWPQGHAVSRAAPRKSGKGQVNTLAGVAKESDRHGGTGCGTGSRPVVEGDRYAVGVDAREGLCVAGSARGERIGAGVGAGCRVRPTSRAASTSEVELDTERLEVQSPDQPSLKEPAEVSGVRR